MRILIFTEVFAPYVCGISSYVEVLKKGLEQLSHKVVIVTSDPTVEKAKFLDDIIRCPAKPVKKNKYGHECKCSGDMKVIDFICSYKPDVVHIHTDTKIGYMGLEVADRCKAPVVFTIHDYFPDRFASDSSDFIWKIKTYFEKRHFIDMLDTADAVTSSCSRADIFVRRAGRKNDVRLIRSATDTKMFDYRRATPDSIAKTRANLGLSQQAAVAVFAGILSVEKNLEFALTAFSKYIRQTDNIQFLIVGDGSETEYLKKLCKKLKIADMVIFSGMIPNAKMPDIYASCDMYVCSYDDGLMSMSFVEAMACGLPVLLKEDDEKIAYGIIKDGTNGFVYKDQEQFAEYLKKLASLDKDMKNRIKKIVRNTIPKDAYASMAQEYLDVYLSLPKKE